MKQDRDIARPKVPERGGVARNALANAVVLVLRHALLADAPAAFADPQAEPVAATEVVVMTGATRDVAVAREDLVVEKKLPDLGFGRIDRQEVIIRQRTRHIACNRRQGCAEGKDMKQLFHMCIVAITVACATPAAADIEIARNLMEANRFEEAREALLPFARSGNGAWLPH